MPQQRTDPAATTKTRTLKIFVTKRKLAFKAESAVETVREFPWLPGRLDGNSVSGRTAAEETQRVEEGRRGGAWWDYTTHGVA